MIMHDAPAIDSFAEDQGKTTMRIVTCAFKLPVSEREGGIRAKLFDFKIRKRKRAHLGAIIVFAEIMIANRLPAAPHFIAGNKIGGFVVGVTIHETVNIAAVPGLLLRAQNGANFRNDGGAAGFLVCRPENYRVRNENQGEPECFHLPRLLFVLLRGWLPFPKGEGAAIGLRIREAHKRVVFEAGSKFSINFASLACLTGRTLFCRCSTEGWSRNL